MTQTGKKRTAKERVWAAPSVAATGKVDGRRGLGLPESEGKLPEEAGAGGRRDGVGSRGGGLWASGKKSAISDEAFGTFHV